MSSTLTTTKNNDNNKNISIEQMFDFKRIHSTSDLFMILLYSPIGVCLFIIRLFIFLYVLLVSQILPHNSFRRSLFLVLGLSVDVDEDYFKNLKTKFIICNHISDVDPIVLSLILPCACVNASQSPQPNYINWLCHMLKMADNDNALEVAMKNFPIVCFPEQSKSNGQSGLFKFTVFNVPLVHLVFIEARRPFFKVNISPFGSHWLADLFWLLFLPVTVYKVKHLGMVSKEENETSEEFVKRTQKEMATKSNLQATNFNFYDKCEFIKRLQAEEKMRQQQLSASRKSKNSPAEIKIDEYSRKVKEILPQVPLNVIKEDIRVTNNIDNTIERILSGVVKYQPETIPTTSSGCDSATSSIKSMVNTVTDSTTVFLDQKNFGAKTFGKTPAERAASFEERKERMYRIARIRYMQKYGLNLDKKD